LRDAYSIFGASYAYVIIEDVSVQQNVLRNEILAIARDIYQRINDLTVHIDWYEVTYRKLCYVEPQMRNCLEHPFINLLNSTNPITAMQVLLRYPQATISNHTIDNALIFGGVTLRGALGADGNGNIARASALRLPFILRSPESSEDAAVNAHWQYAFVDLLSKLRYPGVQLYYNTAVTWSSEIERNGELILPYLPVLFVTLTIFCVYSCFTSDWVVSKPWLALCGIINACCAVISTMGTLVYVGFPFLQMVYIMPFLILSISVDNMFLMLSSWRATHPLQSVEDRMAKAMGDTAVSIMITALTNGLSFSVGSISQFMAVRTFCTYCALAILFGFLYQMTFFTACMALTGRREAANRHCLTFQKITPRSDCDDRSLIYRLFCASGYRTTGPSRVIPSKLDQQFLTEFF
uniref:SSD domain-containing protein n=1 Tax=Plectus sambesii TaxID=2011161 RepID=A0A914V5Z8_9BILA